MSVQVDIITQTIEVQIVEDEVVNIAIWDGVSVLADGVLEGTTRAIDFISGDNITISTTQEGNKILVTIGSSGGGGGSGDVTGPSSSTDGEVVLYNGATGKVIKNSNNVLTTVGGNILSLTNPSAITFLRINADNTVTAVSTIPVTSGGTGTNTQFTQGSVMFAGASGVYSQNNAKYFWDNTAETLFIGANSTTFTGVKINSIGSTNSYLQNNIQNTSNGATASSDWIATADNGSDTDKFGDFGINSSGWSGTGVLDAANTVYLYGKNVPVSIGVDGNATFKIFTGGILAANERISITGTGVYTFTGSSTAIHKELFDGLGVTQTNGAGLWLANTTAAALGAPQISPSTVYEGYAWNIGSSTSISERWSIDNLPSSSTTTTSTFRIRRSTAGGAYVDIFTISSGSSNQFNFSGGTNTAFLNALIYVYQFSGTERSRMGSDSTSGYLLMGSSTYNALLYVKEFNRSSAFKPVIQLEAGNNTTMTAATEFNFALYNNTSASWTWADGTVTTQRFNWFKGFTLNRTTTSGIFTDAYNCYIDDLTFGTGVTGRKWSLGLVGSLNVGGRIYLGGSAVTPTAFLHIAAGVSGNAQIRLAPGVAPSSPNDGDIYYVDTNDRLMFRKNATDAEVVSASAVTTEAVVSDTTLTITFNGVTYKLLARA